MVWATNMSYQLIQLTKQGKIFVSKKYESTIKEEIEFTKNMSEALLFKDFPKAHKFIKKYYRHLKDFVPEYTGAEYSTNVNIKIEKTKPFEL